MLTFISLYVNGVVSKYVVVNDTELRDSLCIKRRVKGRWGGHGLRVQDVERRFAIASEEDGREGQGFPGGQRRGSVGGGSQRTGC